VFTPNVLLDWGSIQPGRYVAAEVVVAVPVSPAALTVATEGTTSAIAFGDALGSSAIAGYSFGGVSAFGHNDVTGSLEWETPFATPGAVGFETDGLGNDPRHDRVFVARAIFTPDASYGGAYLPYPLDIPVTVNASADAKAALAEEMERAELMIPHITIASENYREEDVRRLLSVVDATRALGSEPSQYETEQATASIEEVIGALVHDHPTMKHSAPNGVKEFGKSVEIGFKGRFETVTGVSLGGEKLTLGAAKDGKATLSKGGTVVGHVEKGSAVVFLNAAFADTVPNGTHKLDVRFEDNYGSGTGTDSFTVDRQKKDDDSGGDDGDGKTDDDDKKDDDKKKDDKKSAGKKDKDSGTSSGTSSGGSSGGSSDRTADAGTSDTDGDDDTTLVGSTDGDTSDSPGETAGGAVTDPPDDVTDEGDGSRPPIVLIIALAAIAAAAVIAALAGRRRAAREVRKK
jgi:hypothetical protein